MYKLRSISYPNPQDSEDYVQDSAYETELT